MVEPSGGSCITVLKRLRNRNTSAAHPVVPGSGWDCHVPGSGLALRWV